MIICIDTNKVKTKIPHEKDFIKWRGNISDKDYDAIVDELNDIFDEKDVHTAGWIPGDDWNGTVYQPIFDACQKNYTHSALFFGLIVYKTFMDRADTWACGKFELNGKNIGSLTYFKLNPNKNSSGQNFIPSI